MVRVAVPKGSDHTSLINTQRKDGLGRQGIGPDNKVCKQAPCLTNGKLEWRVITKSCEWDETSKYKINNGAQEPNHLAFQKKNKKSFKIT